MKILLLAKYDRLGASSRLRFYSYLPYLIENGAEIKVLPLLDNEYIESLYREENRLHFRLIKSYIARFYCLFAACKYDLVWIEKEIFPYLPGWAESFLAYRRIPYVVDYDDAQFHRYDLHTSVLVRKLLSGKIYSVMRNSTLTIAGNEYLAQHARKAGAKHVVCVPTVIDLHRYQKKNRNAGEKFIIGWIGSPSTEKYLSLIEDSLAEVCKAGNVEIVLVGARKKLSKRVPSTLKPWSEETESGVIRSFDVGVMPLNDSLWERGKCGYKLVQYMASAIPVVASPVGINTQIVENGVNGFLAKTKDDWISALIKLKDSKALREEMGEAGRNKVERQYCLQVTAPQLIAHLKAAAATGRRGLHGTAMA
jgi:glycosyltransferase involved in cell wall biosynthesis